MTAALNTPTLSRTPAEVLSQAADYIGRHGWWQEDYYDNGEKPFPKCCALGAIGMAVYGHVEDCPSLPSDRDCAQLFAASRHALRCWLVDGLGLDPGDPEDSYAVIAEWNDHPNQTAFAVQAQLFEAADRWRRRHGGVS